MRQPELVDGPPFTRTERRGLPKRQELNGGRAAPDELRGHRPRRGTPSAGRTRIRWRATRPSRSRARRSRSAVTARGRVTQMPKCEKTGSGASSTARSLPRVAGAPGSFVGSCRDTGEEGPPGQPRTRHRLGHRHSARLPGRRTSKGWDPASSWAIPGRSPTPGASMPACTARSCGPCASTPASAPPSRPTSASSSSSRPGRPGCRAPSTCPPRWATTPTTPGPRARSARWASPSTRWPTCVCSWLICRWTRSPRP